MSETLSASLMDAQDTGLVLLGEGDQIVHANPALIALLGRDLPAGGSILDALGVRPEWIQGVATLTISRPDGDPLQLRLTRRPFQGQHLVTVQIRPTASEIAVLTRKIIHDINNQLQVVSISGGTLSSISTPGSASWEDANEICEAVEKAHRMLVQLQRLVRHVPAEHAPEPPPETPQTHSPAILLVESHDRIGEATARVLNRSGYRATAVTDPNTAIDLFATEAEDWKLAILSMRLRHTTGIDLARMLRRAQPNLPIILCVSGADQPDQFTREQAGIAAVIQKPFSHAELTRTVKQLLP